MAGAGAYRHCCVQGELLERQRSFQEFVPPCDEKVMEQDSTAEDMIEGSSIEVEQLFTKTTKGHVPVDRKTKGFCIIKAVRVDRTKLRNSVHPLQQCNASLTIRHLCTRTGRVMILGSSSCAKERRKMPLLCYDDLCNMPMFHYKN